jgi:hypothetical protein
VHVRYVCIASFIMSYLIHALHSIWGNVYSIPIFYLVFLRNICRYFFLGWQLKHIGLLLFCLGISKPLSMRIGLVLPYMLGLEVISFSISMSLLFFLSHFSTKKKKNKKLGRRCETLFLSFDSFSDIACVFSWYLSSLCID